MNCKPGDLAVVVSSGLGMEGRIIRVTHLLPVLDFAAWDYEGCVINPENGRRFDAFSDECLRPIRDPGEDATDEALDWLPVPTTSNTKNKETA